MNLKEPLIVYYTITRKEVVRILRIWPQSIFPSVIVITLYFLVFGKIIGSRIGVIDSLDYLSFITPGLIIMAVINNAYTNVASSFFGVRFDRSIEGLLVSSASRHLIILGYISGGIIRGGLVGFLVSIVALLLGGITVILSYSSVFLVFILCGILFSLAGLINGVLSKKFDDVTIIPSFVLVPLTYLGGIFYSINSLESFWQFILMFNPVFYIIDFIRYGFFGISFINPFVSLVFIVIFIILLYMTVWYLISNRKNI